MTEFDLEQDKMKRLDRIKIQHMYIPWRRFRFGSVAFSLE